MNTRHRYVLFPFIFITIFITNSWGQQVNPFTATQKAPTESKQSSQPQKAVESGTLQTLSSMQKQLNAALSDTMKQLKDHPSAPVMALTMLIAFGYGFIHALGPGHRKTILAALFASGRYRKRDALGAGMSFAFLHASSAVAIVGFLYFLSSGPISAGMDKIGLALEKGSFLLLVGIGLWIMISAIRALMAKEDKPAKKGVTVITIIGSGLIPCPGAALILSFALVYDIVPYGIVAVFCMSVGMGTALSIIAVAAKSIGASLIKLGERSKRTDRIHSALEFAGGVVITTFALFMLT
jgi:ABC-type nickel/cobalt efflux system permease component RcnA